jgi:FkbM family methyltransferase
MQVQQIRADRGNNLCTTLRLALRKAVLATLRRFNPGDISIRHHYTGDRIKLHSFMHKGYWFHGKRREHETMELFARLIAPADTVIEIGGHIGYISLYFSHLVGSQGKVVVFEPGMNNLPYTRANLSGKANVLLVEKAAADFTGTAPFYVENYTGQNNSLLSDYAPFEENLRNAGLQTAIRKSVVEVECVKLDEFLAHSVADAPSLIKIDVEGAEIIVLKGMADTLRLRNASLMIEVTDKAEEVFNVVTAAGYKGFTEACTPIQSAAGLRGNTFWLKEGDPRIHHFRARL